MSELGWARQNSLDKTLRDVKNSPLWFPGLWLLCYTQLYLFTTDPHLWGTDQESDGLILQKESSLYKYREHFLLSLSTSSLAAPRFIEMGYLCQGTGMGLNESKNQLPPYLPHHLLPAVEGQQQSVTIPRDCRGPAMGTSPYSSGSSPLQTFRAAKGWWFLIQQGPLPFDWQAEDSIACLGTELVTLLPLLCIAAVFWGANPAFSLNFPPSIKMSKRLPQHLDKKGTF